MNGRKQNNGEINVAYGKGTKKTMVKSMLHMARVEKDQWLNQCCIWQGWKKTNGQINVAYGKGGKKPMIKSMLPIARVEKNQCSNQWCRRQWKANVSAKKRTDTKSQKQHKQKKE